MKFMIPLGFIAILSVAILVVIYLIKPSYKSKTLPSTYIWKESLKYRKKDKKDSLFRNILSFLCQAAALVALTAIITYPVITISADDKTDLTVVIIDASADMRASNGAETRFQRAKNGAAETIKKSTDKKIPVTIILADTDSKYLAENELNYDKLISGLTAAECGFGSGDIGGAAELVKKAAMVLPQVGYIGWDVAITENGPAIIEGNNYCAYDFPQLPDDGWPKFGLLGMVRKAGVEI